MQHNTVWWTLGLAAALATGFALGESGMTQRIGRATADTAFRAPPTGADRARQASYLTDYSARKFAPLFALLTTAIPAEGEKRLREILAEREISMANARESAAKAGLNFDAYCDGQAVRIDGMISAELGADIARRVREYLHTLPQRVMIGSIEHVLIYRGAPMTVEQMEQLTVLLNEREVPPPSRRPSAEDWERFIAAKEIAYRQIGAGAASFLSGPQLAAVKEEFNLQVGLLRMQDRSFTPANSVRAPGAADAGR